MNAKPYPHIVAIPLLLVWMLLAAPFRALDAALWLVWQAALWAYRLAKSLRMTVELWEWHAPHDGIENSERYPHVWETAKDYFKSLIKK